MRRLLCYRGAAAVLSRGCMHNRSFRYSYVWQIHRWWVQPIHATHAPRYPSIHKISKSCWHPKRRSLGRHTAHRERLAAYAVGVANQIASTYLVLQSNAERSHHWNGDTIYHTLRNSADGRETSVYHYAGTVLGTKTRRSDRCWRSEQHKPSYLQKSIIPL
jgi:hypothetical protein